MQIWHKIELIQPYIKLLKPPAGHEHDILVNRVLNGVQCHTTLDRMKASERLEGLSMCRDDAAHLSSPLCEAGQTGVDCTSSLTRDPGHDEWEEGNITAAIMALIPWVIWQQDCKSSPGSHHIHLN